MRVLIFDRIFLMVLLTFTTFLPRVFAGGCDDRLAGHRARLPVFSIVEKKMTGQDYGIEVERSVGELRLYNEHDVELFEVDASGHEELRAKFVGRIVSLESGIDFMGALDIRIDFEVNNEKSKQSVKSIIHEREGHEPLDILKVSSENNIEVFLRSQEIFEQNWPRKWSLRFFKR